MTRREAAELQHGLYRLYWKAGGSSLAAVGSTYNGVRWFAPANWTAPNAKHPQVSSTNWRMVKSATFII